MVQNLLLALIIAILTVSAIRIDTDENMKTVNKDDESDGSEYLAYNSSMSIRKFME